MLLISTIAFSQSVKNDTIKYNGYFVDCFLMESYTLYPDHTFKWTSEFDLSWNEYGRYTRNDNILKFDFYIQMNDPKTMSLRDSIQVAMKSQSQNKPIRTEYLEDADKNLYYVDKNGKRKPTKKKAPCKRPFGWLFGNKYEYVIYRTNEDQSK